MTDTRVQTVEIPADVKDNNSLTVRVQWRGSVPEELTEQDLVTARWTFGYIVDQWDDVDRKGNRVTITRMDKRDGRNVWLYETSYFTRVKCAECAPRWAQVYQVVTIEGVSSDPVPRCGEHADVFRRATRGTPGVVVTESEPLRIGQH
jgi:hypothetical protein